MPADEVRLEAFGERLKGYKMYCVGSPNLLPSLLRSRLSILDSEVGLRGRKVLIIQEGCAHLAWLNRFKWDAVFTIKDNSDLRLAVTYITNCARPARVVWAAATEPAAQIFSHLSKSEGLSFIGIGATVPTGTEWDAIFWTHDTAADSIESVLNARVGAVVTGKYNISSVLKEIRGSELGLVWSSIGESDKRGFLYWFDPSEGQNGSAGLYTLEESAEILRSIAQSLTCGRA